MQIIKHLLKIWWYNSLLKAFEFCSTQNLKFSGLDLIYFDFALLVDPNDAGKLRVDFRIDVGYFSPGSSEAEHVWSGKPRASCSFNSLSILADLLINIGWKAVNRPELTLLLISIRNQLNKKNLYSLREGQLANLNFEKNRNLQLINLSIFQQNRISNLDLTKYKRKFSINFKFMKKVWAK